MPTKKRKYEARFPPARIKKIMQTDEEIGKVAAAVPVIISRALEIFLQQLVEKSAEQTKLKRAKTMTTGHLKQCIESENQFDFLKDLVANIADMPNHEEDDNTDFGETKAKKPRKQRVQGERKRKTKKRQKSSSSNDSDDEENASDNNEETTTIFPREPSDVANVNHSSSANYSQEAQATIHQHSASTSSSSSHTFPNPFNSLNASSVQPMPMMVKPQDDDDDEDYDEEE